MIKKRYVLFTRIPIYKEKSGKLFCDLLWAKDLKLHMGYLDDFSLCCPIISIMHEVDVEGKKEITNYDIKQIFPLRKDGGVAISN